MSQDGGNGRQNQDRNNNGGSGLLLWAGLIVATGLLLIFLVMPYFHRELSIDALKRLITANQRVEVGGKLKEGATEYADVQDKDKHYRYSNLRKVVVNKDSIVGIVDVAELSPQGTKNQLVAN